MGRMVILDVEIAGHAKNALFTGYQVVNMTAIALAESGGDTHAVNVVDKNPAAASYRSLDLGLWQINTYWWPGPIPDRLNPATCARIAFDIWRNRFNDARTDGKSWSEASEHAYGAWNVYESGAYKQYIPRAKTAAAALG